MIKNITIALGLLPLLTGCGSDSSDDVSTPPPAQNPSAPYTPPAQEPYIPPTTPIQEGVVIPWETTKVVDKMSSLSVSAYKLSNECGSADSSVIETDHFIVGFDKTSTRFVQSELESSARAIEVGLLELLEHTQLDSLNDLGISEGDRWLGCYADTKTGNGSGSARKFDYSPDTVDVNHPDFGDSHVLVKHELFHVIQSALLGEEQVFLHLPRWYQEASAEFFAGRDSTITSVMLENFTHDTGLTPYAIDSTSKEDAIDRDTSQVYHYAFYKMYHNSLNYLVSRDLSIEQMLSLTKDSYGGNFDSAIASLENELSLPTTYDNLRDQTAVYNEHVTRGWLATNEIGGGYNDDLVDDVTELFIMDEQFNELAKGYVHRDQQSYVLTNPVEDGQYEIYVNSNEVEYGPMTLTSKNGSFGDIDLSGIGLCTVCDD